MGKFHWDKLSRFQYIAMHWLGTLYNYAADN